MTLTQLRDEVFRYLRDTDREFVTNLDVRAWLNQAQRDLAQRLQLFEATAAGVADTNTLALPADFLDVQQVIIGAADAPVVFVDDDEYLKWAASSSAALPPQGTVARISGTNIEVYPTPSDAWTLRYVSAPTDLSADGDESPMPTELEWKMVHFAVAQGYYKESEPGMGDRFMDMYQAGLPGALMGGGRRFPGPMQLSMEPTHWDMQGTHVG